MPETATSTTRGWHPIERYVYLERSYEEVWSWLAGHLSTIGDPLPDGARAVDLRIRPGGREVSRPVRLKVGGVVCGERSASAALRWVDATRPGLFPQLEAVLEIAPVPHTGRPFTQLGILARYRPPLGPLGAIGDRLVGGDVIDVALTIFLDDLARAAVENIEPSSLESQVDREADHSAPEDPDERRLFLTLDGLTVRPGGAVGAARALMALPGVVTVSLDPWAGLAAVDHDPERCGPDQMLAALDESAPSGAAV